MTAGGGGFSNNINSDMNVYNCALQQFKSLAAEYKVLLSHIKGTHAHDPGTQLWLFQVELFPQILQGQQYQIIEYGAAENVASDLRQVLSDAQNAYNWITSHHNTPGARGASGSTMQQFASTMKKDLQEFNQLGHDFPGITAILGPDAINNLVSQANAIMGYFSNGHGGHSNISPQSMANQIISWANQGAGPIVIPIRRGGSGNVMPNPTPINPASAPVPSPTVSPTIQNINGLFANINQTLSGTSAKLQTQIQTYAQNLQQFIGAYKSDYDTYSQYVNFILNNFPKG